MNADDPPLTDELSAILEAWDDALAAGGDLPPTWIDAPDKLRPLVSRGVAALQLLQHLRPPRAPSDPPRRVGRFVIRRELGSGSFGTVYLAHDPSLSRDVALKVPHGQGLVSRELRQRFQQEACAAASLDHPNLVAVHETGEADGVLYLATAYCPGDTLAAWLRSHPEPVPPADAAALVAALAAGVAHAHGRGVLHRDLKPGNVLLQDLHHRDTETPRRQEEIIEEEKKTSSSLLGASVSLGCKLPKIADFGLARFLLEDGPASGLTRTGAVVGTPCYMSPEQALAAKDIGPAADVYSLGAILYELLTRRPPFSGETHLDTLDQVRHNEPVAPRSLRPGVPRDLETICLKCLQKLPSRRYASAEELRLDLGRYLAGEPIHARPVGSLERAVRTARRRPGTAALVAALVLVTLTGVGGVFWKYLDAEKQKRLAVNAALDAQQQAEAATAQERIATAQLRRAEMAAYGLQLIAARGEWEAHQPAQAALRLAETTARLRGWEYGHIRRLFQGSDLTLRHNGATSVAVDQAGTLLASGGADGLVRLWDPNTGQAGPVLAGHDGAVRCVAVSRDARFVASASADKTARVWDPRTGKQLHVFRDHEQSVEGVAFSPDGTQLATCSLDKSARLFAVGNWQEEKVLRDQPRGFRGVIWQKANKGVLLVEEGRGVTFWPPMPNGKPSLLIPHANTPGTLALRQGGRVLITASRGEAGSVALPLPFAQFASARYQTWPQYPLCLAMCPSDLTLAQGVSDGTIQAVNATLGRVVKTLIGHTGPVQSVTFVDTNRVASAADDTVRVWSLLRGPEKKIIPTSLPVMQAGFCPRGERLACSVLGLITIYDARTLAPQNTLEFDKTKLARFAFHPDGKRLAVAGPSGLKLFDLASGAVVRDFDAAGQVIELAFQAEGKLLAGTMGTDVILWEVETGKAKRVQTRYQHAAWSLAFSPDGKRLVTGGDDRNAKVWDVETGELLRALNCEPGGAAAVAFGQYGTLATAGSDGVIHLWDAERGEPLRSFKARQKAPTQVKLAFSPDGHRLATVYGTTGDIWDVETGQTVLPMPPSQLMVTSLEFSPDGKRLLTAEARTMTLWLSDGADSVAPGR